MLSSFRLIFISCLFGLSTYIAHAQPKSKKAFVWGVNGHPFTQVTYKPSTWRDQMIYLSDLNVDYYRVDLRLTKTGLIYSDKIFFDFMDQLRSHNIKPMFALFPREDKMQGDSAVVYKEYYQQGKSFTQRYGSSLEVVEVGNEWDLKLMKRDDKLDGTKSAHYNLENGKKRLWLLKGFIDGIKSVNPTIKVSLSLTWTHWYYLELLQAYNVNYDIIGYHWYSNMGNMTKVRSPYGNFLPKIKNTYKKAIWVTEFNAHRGTKSSSFEKQNNYVQENINDLLEQGIVSGLFIYELFDQLALRPRFPSESHYGLLYSEGGVYKKKPIYFTYKDIISLNKK